MKRPNQSSSKDNPRIKQLLAQREALLKALDNLAKPNGVKNPAPAK